MEHFKGGLGECTDSRFGRSRWQHVVSWGWECLKGEQAELWREGQKRQCKALQVTCPRWPRLQHSCLLKARGVSLVLCSVRARIKGSRAVQKLRTTRSYSYLGFSCFSLVFTLYITMYWSIPHFVLDKQGEIKKEMCIYFCFRKEECTILSSCTTFNSPFCVLSFAISDTFKPVAFKCLGPYISYFLQRKMWTLAVIRDTSKYVLSFGLCFLYSSLMPCLFKNTQF